MFYQSYNEKRYCNDFKNSIIPYFINLMIISLMCDLFHTEIDISLIGRFAVQIVQKCNTNFAQN